MSEGSSKTSSQARDLQQVMRDPAAFEVFYRRNAAAVCRFMPRRMSDPHTVDANS
ncbi:hypothetical protein ACH35V_19010 [Actinomadura sp. 1N219]|uniref:hypothetical protein n=1 Tax=Actinomadura sp. 1N219 TaxID=3375152 RepID=UPI00378EA2B4